MLNAAERRPGRVDHAAGAETDSDGEHGADILDLGTEVGFNPAGALPHCGKYMDVDDGCSTLSEGSC